MNTNKTYSTLEIAQELGLNRSYQLKRYLHDQGIVESKDEPLQLTQKFAFRGFRDDNNQWTEAGKKWIVGMIWARCMPYCQ